MGKTSNQRNSFEENAAQKKEDHLLCNKVQALPTEDDLVLKRVGPSRAERPDLGHKESGDMILRSQGPSRREVTVEPSRNQESQEKRGQHNEREPQTKSLVPSEIPAKNMIKGSDASSSELLGEDELCLMLEESDAPTPSPSTSASLTPLSNFDGVEEEEESGDEEEGDRANQSLDDLFGKVIADMEKDLSDLPDMFSDEDINEQAKIVVRESKKSAEQDSMFISSMSQPLAISQGQV